MVPHRAAGVKVTTPHTVPDLTNPLWFAVTYAAEEGMGADDVDAARDELSRLQGLRNELPCQKCGRDNPVWWVDDDIWNRVMGRPDNPRGEGIIVCPSCFSRDLFEQLEVADKFKAAMVRANQRQVNEITSLRGQLETLQAGLVRARLSHDISEHVYREILGALNPASSRD
jgi:hypothetical protein